jgi:hypothetical protein
MPGKTKNPEKNLKFHHNSSQRINQRQDLSSIFIRLVDEVNVRLTHIVRSAHTPSQVASSGARRIWSG